MNQSISIFKKMERDAMRPFGEAAQRYLDEFTGKDADAVANILAGMCHYFGDMPIIEVDDGAISEWRSDYLQGRGLFDDGKGQRTAGTVNQRVGYLAAVMNRASKHWRWIPQTPYFERPRGMKKQSIALTYEEEDQLFAALPEHWRKGLCKFAINAGVREQEVTGMKWTDIREFHDPYSTYVIIAYGKSKEVVKPRAVILNSLAKEAVDYERNNGSRYIFPSRCASNRGGKLGKTWKLFSACWKNAGLPSGEWQRTGIHNLRHTFISRLAAHGVYEKRITDALAGHHGTDIWNNYTQQDVYLLESKVEKLTNRKKLTFLRM